VRLSALMLSNVNENRGNFRITGTKFSG